MATRDLHLRTGSVALRPKPARIGRGGPGASAVAPWRNVDLTLLLVTGLIAALGSIMVFSATRGSQPGAADTATLSRHLSFLAAGVTVMALTTLVDYRRLRSLTPVIYGGSCAMLAAVLTPLGTEVKGSQAWFQLGGLQLQPSELAKPALVLALAGLCSRLGSGIGLGRLAALLVVAALPLGLILAQPDLGTALVFVAIAMGVLLVAGIRVRHLAGLALAGIVAVVGVLDSGVLQEYQMQRLTTFVDPGSALGAEAYNLNQSRIAIGSGGLTGQGLFEGTQTRLDIVPEQHTDFIFTAVGEELGFVGSATLLALFGILCWRLWRIAQLSQDAFGTLVCVGVLSMLIFQIFQNAGMTMGIMPITGIPLPLVSYGGSASVAAFAALGLAQNVHMRRFS